MALSPQKTMHLKPSQPDYVAPVMAGDVLMKQQRDLDRSSKHMT